MALLHLVHLPGQINLGDVARVVLHVHARLFDARQCCYSSDVRRVGGHDAAQGERIHRGLRKLARLDSFVLVMDEMRSQFR